jgi:hypothetical protein
MFTANIKTQRTEMVLVAAAARCGARSAAKKAARSLSSGADVLAGSGYVAMDAERRNSSQRDVRIGINEIQYIEYPSLFVWPKK